MFEKRRQVGEKRLEKLEVLKEMLADLDRERMFEEGRSLLGDGTISSRFMV
jgi:hypothetical protein